MTAIPHTATLVRYKGSNLIFRKRYHTRKDRAMSVQFHIGIDLGGTKIEGAAIDNRGSIHVRRRIVTPAVATLAVLLGVFTAEFATWRFVA